MKNRYNSPYKRSTTATAIPKTAFSLKASGDPVKDNKAFGLSATSSAGTSFRGNSPMVNSQGQINADDNAHAMKIITDLLKASASGEIQDDSKVRLQAMGKENNEEIKAALQDPTGDNFKVVGQAIGDEIWLTQNRNSFGRKLLVYKEAKNGEVVKFRVREKNIVSYQATGPEEMGTARPIRGYLIPDEYILGTKILIDDITLRQDSGDILEDKYVDGVESQLVKEDRNLITLANAAAHTAGNVSQFGHLNPTAWAIAKENIMQWNLTATQAIMSVDLWTDITSNTEFQAFYSPVEQHEIVLTGKLGVLMGVEIHTDGYRVETFKVLNRGELYMFGQPSTLGGFMQGKPLEANEINGFNDGRAERGWFLHQTEGMVIGNINACSFSSSYMK